jgi:hypothetical protein
LIGSTALGLQSVVTEPSSALLFLQLQAVLSLSCRMSTSYLSWNWIVIFSCLHVRPSWICWVVCEALAFLQRKGAGQKVEVEVVFVVFD